jgi:hypothetical protein
VDLVRPGFGADADPGFFAGLNPPLLAGGGGRGLNRDASLIGWGFENKLLGAAGEDLVEAPVSGVGGGEAGGGEEGEQGCEDRGGCTHGRGQR